MKQTFLTFLLFMLNRFGAAPEATWWSTEFAQVQISAEFYEESNKRNTDSLRLLVISCVNPKTLKPAQSFLKFLQNVTPKFEALFLHPT